MESVTTAIERARALAARAERTVLAVVGPPGSGKTTLAGRVVAAVGPAARVVPMDGFHLSQRELHRLGRADRKGAIDTFDAVGYLNLLQRVAADDGDVFAPDFDRAIEEPIAGSILIDGSVRLVICEGNYLLLDQPPWNAMRPLFAEAWYCELPDNVRLARLVERHHAFGKSLDGARAWALGSDEINAELIRPTRSRADLTVCTADATRSDHPA